MTIVTPQTMMELSLYSLLLHEIPNLATPPPRSFVMGVKISGMGNAHCLRYPVPLDLKHEAPFIFCRPLNGETKIFFPLPMLDLFSIQLEISELCQYNSMTPTQLTLSPYVCG